MHPPHCICSSVLCVLTLPTPPSLKETCITISQNLLSLELQSYSVTIKGKTHWRFSEDTWLTKLLSDLCGHILRTPCTCVCIGGHLSCTWPDVARSHYVVSCTGADLLQKID